MVPKEVKLNLLKLANGGSLRDVSLLKRAVEQTISAAVKRIGDELQQEEVDKKKKSPQGVSNGRAVVKKEEPAVDDSSL